MKIKFKGPRVIDGLAFDKGVQEVPDSLAGHWYLLALIANGQAMIVEDAKSESKNDETYREHMADWESKKEKQEAQKEQSQSEPKAAKPEKVKKPKAKKPAQSKAVAPQAGA